MFNDEITDTESEINALRKIVSRLWRLERNSGIKAVPPNEEKYQVFFPQLNALTNNCQVVHRHACNFVILVSNHFNDPHNVHKNHCMFYVIGKLLRKISILMLGGYIPCRQTGIGKCIQCAKIPSNDSIAGISIYDLVDDN